MKIRDFILSLVSWFILLVTVSCSDELGGERAPISSESNLHVLVPTVLSSRGTRTDDASGLPTYNATVDECQINDLTLYAFPIENDGKLLVETLPAPLATMMVEPNVANYQLNIEPGTYHIYVVANMNKVLSGKNIQTEDDLKNIVLYYRPTSTPGMPVCTNIPMIYEPKDVNGTIIDTKIEKSGKKYTEVAANLKFTCVKVKLNLIFDPTAEGSAFNGNSYSIKDILAQKLSPSTTLSWDGAFSNSNVSPDYANGFESEVYATPSEASNKGGYYKAEDWKEVAANANVNDKDIITLVQGATPKAAPQNAAAKWLFQGTYYLPERYIAKASQQSTLKVNGSVNGSIENSYTINLGHRQDESPTSTEVPTFPRGTYYEIIGKIKSLGNMTLDCNVSVKDWTPVEIDADFNHTKLWVSKTEANVTSMKNDYITYNSNAGYVEFGCDTKINSKDIIIGTKRGKDANGNDSIEFRVNPDIPISAYSAQSGTAKFWLKANNLKKYIDVHYDVTPYLDVTKELVIYYNKDDKSQNIRNIEWDTNLGGIKLDRTTDTKGNSTIKMSVNSSNDATGTFTVTATEDPVTTTIHEFTVTSKDGSMPQIVRVKVSPPIGDYRIYFRAINDRSKYTGSKNTDRFTAIMPEGGDNNWYDGWDNDGGKNTAKEDNHHIYMYTQIGETSEGTSTLTQKRWIYTKGDASKDEWPGEAMKADNTNKGWYYKDFKVNMEPVVKKGTTENRFIKPGETLIMFNNNQDLDLGYTLHRCPHHREPGIPLFDYE
ncbi:fimbrial protein, partial [Prevotella sp.]|uniref:fimbrial protein n=1 Tax=Prevotella sp. TaxID=59823 RepID=UPI0025E568EB